MKDFESYGKLDECNKIDESKKDNERFCNIDMQNQFTNNVSGCG